MEEFPGNRFILTSRPEAEADWQDWFARQKFERASLQDMRNGDVDNFIDHWHKAVAEALLEAERLAEAEELPPLAAHLKEQLRRQPALASLAVNPLLCAMLCALNCNRQQQLPNRRKELYEACIKMLLEGRERERGIIQPDYPNLGYEANKKILQALAYWMMDNGHTEISQAQALRRIEREMARQPNLPPEETSERILGYFIQRSSLLRQPVTGRVDFAHRTFQEYLTAQEIVDDERLPALLERSRNDQWREVIILAASLAKQREVDDLVKGLIERGQAGPEQPHRLYLLAAACVEAATRLSPEVKARVEACLAEIIPPQDWQQGEALATAGELAIPHLEQQADTEPEIAYYCIQTLGMIGGPGALLALEGYATDDRDEIRQALLALWADGDFERRTFARKILTKAFRDKTQLQYVGPVSSLEGIEALPHLTDVRLGEHGGVESSLSELTLLPGWLDQLASIIPNEYASERPDALGWPDQLAIISLE